MGVEYSLNDPAKGECFDFGKGWHGVESSTDYDPAPAANPEGCYRAGPPVGYRWTPIASRDDALRYVTTHFYFLEREAHSEECRRKNRDLSIEWSCDKWCGFNEPDMEYANAFADKLWTWLEGRDQSQLDVTDDGGDDITCDGGDDHDESCEKYVADGYGRHFFLTGSRYLETERG